MNIINRLNFVRISIFTKLWTIFNRTNAYLWSIQLGKRSIFCGKAIFHKAVGSKITIGHNCMFVSNPNSRNLIGINRPCIVNTQNSKSVIQIGNNSGFSGTVIGASVMITIGNNVNCGANTLIIDSDWHPDDPRSGEPQPVYIEDNVWLGANVVVLKGVSIGKGTVIGANSIVTKNIPAGVMAAGNPCKVIRLLSTEN